MNKTPRESFIEQVLALKSAHHYCEDSWYSCPKAEGGCADDRQGDECNCGAEKRNEALRRIVVLYSDATHGAAGCDSNCFYSGRASLIASCGFGDNGSESTQREDDDVDL